MVAYTEGRVIHHRGSKKNCVRVPSLLVQTAHSAALELAGCEFRKCRVSVEPIVVITLVFLCAKRRGTVFLPYTML
jgi:hypothetical protein